MNVQNDKFSGSMKHFIKINCNFTINFYNQT